MDKKLPAEFIERMKPLLQDELDAFVASYDNPELHALRFKNELTQKALLPYYNELGIDNEDPVPWAEASYYYKDELKPGQNVMHEMGLYYIQEPSAMGPAALLAPNPGERVLDLCAAPGGKSTGLAFAMEGQGLLVSNEIHPARAKILASNIERLGIANALVLNEDSANLKEHFPEFFHKILVDAPCSGEGMFRKNSDAIDEWSLDNVRLCADRQAGILDNAAAMLMPGGKLLYSTCTFSKEENEDTIHAFCGRHPDFKLETMQRFWPHKDRGEGHFMALLVRDGELDMHTKSSMALKKLDKNKGSLLTEFLEDCLTNEAIDASLPLEHGFLTFGDQIYLAPPECPALTGLKVCRAGLHLGEVKKDRFEPAHALALYLNAKDAKRSFDLSDSDAKAYLRGEAKSGLDLSKKDYGWCLLTFRGFPMGWGKASGNQIKNHYPKGLRKN